MTERRERQIPYALRCLIAASGGVNVKTLDKAIRGEPIRGMAGVRARAALVQYAAALEQAAAALGAEANEPGEGQK